VILFDIDGTLLLTGGAGTSSLARVFEEMFEAKGSIEGVAVHGQTDPAIIQAISRRWLGRELSEDEIARLVERYLIHLEERLAASTTFRVLPGAHAIVEALSSREDAVLGLATGNFEPAAYAKLRRAGLERYFPFGGFGSDSIDRSELTRRGVERGRAIAGADAPALVIGDTIFDVRSGRAAGAQVLAVATGNASQEELVAAGADWTAAGLDDPLVARVLGLDGVALR
jgi:phosphoglycolate phosphatase-like HAD superfamily hydrolase